MATQTVTNTSAPWIDQQPFLRSGFNQAASLFNTGGPQFFQGSTVTPFSDQSKQALGMIENRAVNGSPLVSGANQLTLDTMGGNYLNSNPYLDQNYDRAASAVTRNFNEAVRPSIDAAFSKAGRYGSGMYQNQVDSAHDQLGRSLSGMAGEMYGNNYLNERNNQMAASMFAPQLAQQPYMDAQNLMSVGNAYEAKDNEALKEQIARHQFEQERPYDNLARYMAFIQGNYGQQSQSQQPLYENKLGTGLGLALTGASLFNTFSDMF